MPLTTNITVQDGSLPAVNLTAGQATNVTPGNQLVITPTTTTGMISWSLVLKSDYGPLNGISQTQQGPVFSFSIWCSRSSRVRSLVF